jgi:hypothetical protein
MSNKQNGNLRKMYRDHQGTWEKLKHDCLEQTTVEQLKMIPGTIVAQLELYDSEINYCIRKQVT